MAKKKPKTDWRIVCTGLVCLTGLEVFAISQGINGLMLATVVGIIAAVVGITIPNPLKTN